MNFVFYLLYSKLIEIVGLTMKDKTTEVFTTSEHYTSFILQIPSTCPSALVASPVVALFLEE